MSAASTTPDADPSAVSDPEAFIRDLSYEINAAVAAVFKHQNDPQRTKRAVEALKTAEAAVIQAVLYPSSYGYGNNYR